MDVHELVGALRVSAGFQHKRDISQVMTTLNRAFVRDVGQAGRPVAIGDDCAAIADGEGHLLFAIEGFVPDFVQRKPWFAGYCGVMVNVSDIYAMGGRPIAVVDALWSRGMQPAADELLAGMMSASERYGVPIVGGHSNFRSESSQLAVAIIGRARRLLSSFSARPGDQLVTAIDLRGCYEEPYAYWNASTTAPTQRLRDDLELLPMLAESGLCDAAKDISMAGTIGTALMLLECSRFGATIHVDAIPHPCGAMGNAEMLRWLTAFPSYGFVLSVRPAHVERVLAHFSQRDIAAACAGEVTNESEVRLVYHGESAPLWDIERESFITARQAEATPARPRHG